jgi:hypothetical protein
VWLPSLLSNINVDLHAVASTERGKLTRFVAEVDRRRELDVVFLHSPLIFAVSLTSHDKPVARPELGETSLAGSPRGAARPSGPEPSVIAPLNETPPKWLWEVTNDHISSGCLEPVGPCVNSVSRFL